MIAANVRRVALDCGDDRLAKCFALSVVPATFDIIGRVLHETRHDMFARRRHVGVDHRGEDHVYVQLFRKAAILRVIVGALDVINARADGDRAAMQYVFIGQSGEARKFAQCNVDLA